MMNKRLLKYIDYIASLAGEEGHKLTIIRVVKFLYLMDLFYVKHTGQRFTTWTWRFWDFGPYCKESLDAIKQAVDENFIDSSSHPSKFDEERDYDLINYSQDRILYEDDLEKHIIQLEKDLSIPLMIQMAMRSYIKKYGNDTSALLDYVYFQTEPMQKAKPRENLDFSTVSKDEPTPFRPAKLSKRKIKKSKRSDRKNETTNAGKK